MDALSFEPFGCPSLLVVCWAMVARLPWLRDRTSLERITWALGVASLNMRSVSHPCLLGILSSMMEHSCEPSAIVEIGGSGGGQRGFVEHQQRGWRSTCIPCRTEEHEFRFEVFGGMPVSAVTSIVNSAESWWRRRMAARIVWSGSCSRRRSAMKP